VDAQLRIDITFVEKDVRGAKTEHRWKKKARGLDEKVEKEKENASTQKGKRESKGGGNKECLIGGLTVGTVGKSNQKRRKNRQGDTRFA